MSTGKHRVTLLITVAILSIGLSGCRQDMQDAPYVEPFERNDFWDNGSANRPLPAGTIARGLLKEDTRYWFGRDDGNQLVNALPERFGWTRDLLDRGQERYE
ncbi:MAG: cytochrome c, partial [Acidobacteriota bacterium]